MKHCPEIGMLACAKAGRDAGRYFIIKQIIDKEHVLIVDGEMRKLENPKKKKIKHLKLTPKINIALQKAFGEGIIMNDAQIRSCIAEMVKPGEEPDGESI